MNELLEKVIFDNNDFNDFSIQGKQQRALEAQK